MRKSHHYDVETGCTSECDLGRCISNVAETRTGVDDYESMDVDAASGGAGPQRCE